MALFLVERWLEGKDAVGAISGLAPGGGMLRVFLVHSPVRTTSPGKSVSLMATCLCDAFFDDVARASVEVLEHLGCEVHFPEGQTCCGQPALNAGDWDSARKVVRHMLEVFSDPRPVILPSASCASMIFHGSHLAFEGDPDLPRLKALSERTWELCDYIVHGLGVTHWPGRYPGRLVFHRSCHSRGSGSADAAALRIMALTLSGARRGGLCPGGGGARRGEITALSGAGTAKLPMDSSGSDR